MADTGYKTVKANKASDGSRVKRDGYAKGPVPEAMQGVKPGKIPGKGYSGPNVVRI